MGYAQLVIGPAGSGKVNILLSLPSKFYICWYVGILNINYIKNSNIITENRKYCNRLTFTIYKFGYYI